MKRKLLAMAMTAGSLAAGILPLSANTYRLKTATLQYDELQGSGFVYSSSVKYLCIFGTGFDIFVPYVPMSERNDR